MAQLTKTHLIKATFTILLLIGAWMVISQADIMLIVRRLEAVGYRYIWILLITSIAMLCGTLAWKYTLGIHQGNVSFLRLFVIRLIGENITFINPAGFIGGDMYKGYKLRHSNIDMKSISSSLIIARVMMISTQVGLFIIVALFYLLAEHHNPTLTTIIVTITSIIGGLTIAAWCLYKYLPPIPSDKFDRPIVRRAYQGWKDTLEAIKHYTSNHRKETLYALGLTILNWLIGSVEILLILYFLGSAVTYHDALLVDQGVLVLKSFGGFVPGQLGVEEYANRLMLGLIGINSLDIWIALSVLRRGRQLFWLLISLFCYAVLGFQHRPKYVTAHSNHNIHTSSNIHTYENH